MKQFTIICYFLSLFIPSMETVIACEDDNCDGVQFDRADFETDDSLKMQCEIVAVLFKIRPIDVNSKVKYTYNYYGDNCDYSPPWKDGCAYQGGHPGWDVRTLYDKNPTMSKHQLFYSLTNGIVILDGKKGRNNTRGENAYNTIAIYDEDARKTTFYLHASDVHQSIEKGKKVKVGDPLGWQGDTGSPGAFHVHLEVQKEVKEGDFMRASGGTKDDGTQTIDPISYLHKSIQEQPEGDMEPGKPSIVKREPQGLSITLKRGEIEKFEIEARAADGVAIASIEFSVEGRYSKKVSCRRNCMEHDASVRYKWNTPREKSYKVTAKVVDVDGATTETYWFVEVPHAPIEITDLSPAADDFDDVQRIEVNVNDPQKFFIEARSDDHIKSISFVVLGFERWTRFSRNCPWFCRSDSFSRRYQFVAIGQYTVVATIESKTGKIVTREWIVTVQRNPGAPSLATPQVTALLSNYPNPFNPETWIPYQLAAPADVTVTIYGIDGTVVRTLSLGHQPIGIYQDKSRAAYWDGKNAFGEPVASGVYFYTLTAGNFTATQKMLMQK